MLTYPGTVTGRFVRAGTSYAVGTIIDGHLVSTDVDLLYTKWQSHWPEPLGFHGGEKAVTCEMILEVPETEFRKIMGKKVAERILAAAKQNAGR